MSVRVGGVDVVESALNTELRVMVLEKIVDRLLMAAPPGILTQPMIDQIRRDCISDMQRKYPDAGIQAK